MFIGSCLLFSLAGMVVCEILRHSLGSSHRFDPNVGSTPPSKLRGDANYIIPESMAGIGDKSKWYAELRRRYDTVILPKDDERSLGFVAAERRRQGGHALHPAAEASLPYDVHDCPPDPPPGYPLQWTALDVLRNWPPDEPNPRPRPAVFQGVCVFDLGSERHKAANYRRAEVPFVVRNDPEVARAAERWNHPGYLQELLMTPGEQAQSTKKRTEYSPNNHFMYWSDKRTRKERREALRNGSNQAAGRGDQEQMLATMRGMERLQKLKGELEDAHGRHGAQRDVNRLQRRVKEAEREQKDTAWANWRPPTEFVRMTYADWLQRANASDDALGPDAPHWYLQLIACGRKTYRAQGVPVCDDSASEWLFDELPFFQPRGGRDRSFYLVEPGMQRGVHCRFGTAGAAAANHFDRGRNAIALLGGRRRYVLARPDQCENMALLPRGHPSARHSAVDFGDPDLDEFPAFARARVNEVVMQPGDVLYLPTNWFHYIVSLDLNVQCNTRSGGNDVYQEEIKKCGF